MGGWYDWFSGQELGQPLGDVKRMGRPGVLQSMWLQRVAHDLVTEQQQQQYLNGLVIFPSFFNLSFNFAMRSWWSEHSHSQLQVLLLVNEWSFSIFRCQEYSQSDFGVDHLVMSICGVASFIVGRECLLWPVYSLSKTVSLCPASFCTPKPNLLVTPGVSWLPTFSF